MVLALDLAERGRVVIEGVGQKSRRREILMEGMDRSQGRYWKDGMIEPQAPRSGRRQSDDRSFSMGGNARMGLYGR